MQSWVFLSAAIAFLTPLPSTAQPKVPTSIVVEAASSIQGIGGHHQKRLLVRLSDDGKVEWETTQWQKPNELHSTRISPERVSDITQRLAGIDSKAIQEKMGPYNRYVDTVVELSIRVNTPKWNRNFTVLNPWPHWPLKPLPIELKAVICEVSRLQAEVTEEPVQPLCSEETAASNQKKSQQ